MTKLRDAPGLSVVEAAHALGTSPESIRKQIRRGALRASRKGLGVRAGYAILVKDLASFARERQLPLTTREKPDSVPFKTEFLESAPTPGDLPDLKLPPFRGSATELIDYVESSLGNVEMALTQVRQLIGEKNDKSEDT